MRLQKSRGAQFKRYDPRPPSNQPVTGILQRKGDLGRIPTKKKVFEGEPNPIEVRKIKDQLNWIKSNETISFPERHKNIKKPLNTTL